MNYSNSIGLLSKRLNQFESTSLREVDKMSDLLIVGPNAWRNILDPFVRYKNDTAMPAVLLTIEDILGWKC